MGTEKRERQKANRRQRQLEESKAERSSKVKRNTLRWSAAIIAAIGAVVLIAWVGGAFDGGDDEEQTEITLPPIDTTPVDTTPQETFPTPEKPEVEIPDAEPTELVVTVLEPGDGPEAAEGDAVTVHYVGVLSADGTEFDNSYDRGDPFTVAPLGSAAVIQGWNDGLLGAQAGSRIQLDIPADQAYGAEGRPPTIGPDAALTFVIDVVAITPAATS